MRNKPKKKKGGPDEFFFDDCPICQAMREAETRGRNPSFSELMEAFAEANKKHGTSYKPERKSEKE